jgi:hypothetical protein
MQNESHSTYLSSIHITTTPNVIHLLRPRLNNNNVTIYFPKHDNPSPKIPSKFYKLKTVFKFLQFFDYLNWKWQKLFIDENDISLETKGLTLHIV